MDNLDFTVYETAHKAQGGLSRLADSMDMSRQVLINKVNYHNDKNKLSLREALSMMAITKNYAILEELAKQLGFRLVPNEVSPEKSLLSAIVNAGADHGKVHQTIEAAFLDQEISPREFMQITDEVNDAIGALHILLATIEKEAGRGTGE